MPIDYLSSLLYTLEGENKRLVRIGSLPTDLREALGQKEDEFRVVFNDPATILWVNGKKYVSKAHNEEFDEEKGLLMCLAKANGISHLKLKKLLKSAEVQTKKEKKEKYDF